MKRGAERVGVIVADLSGFGAITDAIGDAAAADLALQFARLARRVLFPHARVVKTMGDAVLAVAPSGAAAFAGAHALVAAAAAESALPPLHGGVAEGPIVWRGGDVFGATVNAAARLADEARPGEIRCSEWLRREPGRQPAAPLSAASTASR